MRRRTVLRAVLGGFTDLGFIHIYNHPFEEERECFFTDQTGIVLPLSLARLDGGSIMLSLPTLHDLPECNKNWKSGNACLVCDTMAANLPSLLQTSETLQSTGYFWSKPVGGSSSSLLTPEGRQQSFLGCLAARRASLLCYGDDHKYIVGLETKQREVKDWLISRYDLCITELQKSRPVTPPEVSHNKAEFKLQTPAKVHHLGPGTVPVKEQRRRKQMSKSLQRKTKRSKGKFKRRVLTFPDVVEK